MHGLNAQHYARHTLQKPAPKIGAIGLNSTPDSGASFFVPMHEVLTSLTAFGEFVAPISVEWSRFLKRVSGALDLFIPGTFCLSVLHS